MALTLPHRQHPFLLIVFDRKAKITGKPQSQLLRLGKSTTLINASGIRIENAAKTELSLIQVELRN